MYETSKLEDQRVESQMVPVHRRESLPAVKVKGEINIDEHRKTASEPISTMDSCNNNKQMLKSDNKNASNKKFEEYHKWKVSGCKGDPPAKLKISQ